MAARRKADAQATPQSTEQAIAAIDYYLSASEEIERLKLDADAAIATIRAARDEAITPIEQEAKATFLALRSWWAVEKDELTEGKRKSIELAGAEIGERMTPPRLTHPALKADDVIERLLTNGWDEMVRTKHTLDKPALIRMLRGDHAPQMEAFGLTLAQREEFFIDRAEPEVADSETVETGDVEVREAAR